jgi:hypothetical protein
MRLTVFMVAAAIGTASPAAAQIVGRPDYGPVARSSPFLPDSSLPAPSMGREVRDLRQRIDAAQDAGTLTRREARALQREARWIGRLAARYGRDGLSAPERAELATRAAAVRARANR